MNAAMLTRMCTMVANPRLHVGGALSLAALEVWCESGEWEHSSYSGLYLFRK